jgi:hypothetical protein
MKLISIKELLALLPIFFVDFHFKLTSLINHIT